MAQEEIHRFPQSDFSKPGECLSVFLHSHMQGIPRGQHLLCGHKAFEFWRVQIVNCLRIFGQSSKYPFGGPLGLGLVGEVPLDAPPSRIVSELIKRLAAIDRLVKFDCLCSVCE
jgi:hypothetical protein